MGESVVERPGTYWYPGTNGAPGASEAGAVEVLASMRAFRTAETAMRRRTRGSMGMGENDLLAVQFLMRRHTSGRPVSPKDLAAYLGISSASTTVLIDRLVKSGHVERQPHPTDRRAIRIVATPTSHREVRETLAVVHRRMLEAAESLAPDEAGAVVRFLDAMRRIVEEPAAESAVEFSPERFSPEQFVDETLERRRA